MILLKSVAYLTVGVIMVTVFSDPMVSALTALTEKNNANYNGESSTFHKGQYIPIGGLTIESCTDVLIAMQILLLSIEINLYQRSILCLHAVFYISFVITPLCSNASELVSSLMFASKKTKISASLTFSQVIFKC
jgi:hypothetical protein